MKAFYRSYVDGQVWRGKQVQRLHIAREVPARRHRRSLGDGDQVPTALCGTAAWACGLSKMVEIEPLPAEPPWPLTWCPHCLGRAADAAGLAPLFGRMLAEATALAAAAGGPETAPP